MPYPDIDPYASGLLDVDDGARLHWETSGTPSGQPVLWLHGGPGSGLRGGGYRRRLDPDRWMIIGLDQRACGRSTPGILDEDFDLASLTTQRMIADLELLREHLGVERWLVSGGSWGSTLALAYAEAHPDRVTGLVLAAVTTTSRDEVEWITEHVGRIFPREWAEFAEASGRRPGRIRRSSAIAASSTDWTGSRSCRPCSSTDASTSADRCTRPSSCTVAGRAAVSWCSTAKGTAARR